MILILDKTILKNIALDIQRERVSIALGERTYKICMKKTLICLLGAQRLKWKEGFSVKTLKVIGISVFLMLVWKTAWS